MTQYTNIEWADHTFNPWIGCNPISPGCIHCYAADWAKRHGRDFAARTRTKTWGDPVKWNKQPFFECQACGRRGTQAELEATDERECDCHKHLTPARQRVFCASLADVFDNAVDPAWRDDLWQLIWDTPNLDWLLLTKRIGNVNAMLPNEWGNGMIDYWPHVWIGATIINQEEADRDIPKLLAVPAAKRFLSMEPLLGPVDIKKWLAPWTCSNCGHHGSEDEGGPCVCDHCGVKTVYDKSDGSDHCPACNRSDEDQGVGFACPVCERASNWDHDYCLKFDREYPLDWVIVGGESGPGARPMHPDWARTIRDQCEAAGVPFLFKQWGEWRPMDVSECKSGSTHLVNIDSRRPIASGTFHMGHQLEAMLTEDPYRWQCPVVKVGKKAAGRLLYGRTWDGYPS